MMVRVWDRPYYLDPFREAVLSVSIPLLCSKQMRVVQLLQQVFTEHNTNTLPLSIQSFYAAFFEAHTCELVKNARNDASEFLIGLFDVFRHPSILSSFKNTLASIFDVSYCQEVICPLGHVSSQLDSHYTHKRQHVSDMTQKRTINAITPTHSPYMPITPTAHTDKTQ